MNDPPMVLSSLRWPNRSKSPVLTGTDLLTRTPSDLTKPEYKAKLAMWLSSKQEGGGNAVAASSFSQQLASLATEVLQKLRFKSCASVELLRIRRYLCRGPQYIPPPRYICVTPQEWATVSEILNSSETYPNLVVGVVDGIEIKRRDFACLKPGEWLNDEIINAYMGLLNQRSLKLIDSNLDGRQYPKTYHWNTFFFSALAGENTAGQLEYSYNRVRRWTKRKKLDIFAMDLVMMPIHVNKMHWALGCIDFRSKLIFFFDSLRQDPGSLFFTMLMRYLDDEHMDKKDGEPLPNREEWLYGGNNFSLSQLVSIEVFESMMNRRTASCFQQTTAIEIPEQDNGSDCGVFACQYAEALGVLRFPFDFSAIDMPTRRIKMGLQIFHNTVEDF